MSQALLDALSRTPPHREAAFAQIKAGARLTPGELAELSDEAIGLYSMLVGMAELVLAAEYWVGVVKTSAEHRVEAERHAKRILKLIMKHYKELAELALTSQQKQAETSDPENEDRPRGSGPSR
jgi:hypothetical protein